MTELVRTTPKLSFRIRRRLSLAVTLVAVSGVAVLAWLEHTRLAHASFLTGSTLLASIALLTLLGLRRRLPVLPLGSASTWLQIHLYTGLFAAGVYVLHVPTLIAGGVFEAGLAAVFLVVTGSGLYGIYACRSVPRRLTAVPGEHRFEQVEWHRTQIADAAGRLLDELQEPASITVLGRYYGESLKPYFAARPTLAYLFAPSSVRRRRLIRGLGELERYMDEEGRRAAGQFSALVRRRDDLDYRHALQFRLRAWAAVHAAFSIVLLAAGVLHAVIAWRFTVSVG
jgi:hypothetical protein